MRTRIWIAVGVAWSAAMIAVGLWMGHSGPFQWRRESLAGLRVAAPLAADVRQRLRPRMQRHAQSMTALTSAVIALDDERVIREAEALLAEPQLAQPLSAEAASLAAELPPQFHEYELALQAHARELVSAARAADDDALIAADARLAWTCARCHAAFHGP